MAQGWPLLAIPDRRHHLDASYSVFGCFPSLQGPCLIYYRSCLFLVRSAPMEGAQRPKAGIQRRPKPKPALLISITGYMTKAKTQKNKIASLTKKLVQKNAAAAPAKKAPVPPAPVAAVPAAPAKASRKAIVSAVAPVSKPEGKKKGEAHNNVIRLEPILGTQLDSLHLQMLQAGANSGYHGANLMMIVYFSVMRWQKVLPEDVTELVQHGEKAFAAFKESLVNRKTEPANADSIVKKPVSVPYFPDFTKRVQDLMIQYHQRGITTGKYRVNNNTVIRQAIRRWRKVTPADVEEFGKLMTTLRA